MAFPFIRGWLHSAARLASWNQVPALWQTTPRPIASAPGGGTTVKLTLRERIAFKAGVFILYPILVIPLVAISLTVTFFIVVAIWPMIPFLELITDEDSVKLKFPWSYNKEEQP